jgi:hypothetical protein
VSSAVDTLVTTARRASIAVLDWPDRAARSLNRLGSTELALRLTCVALLLHAPGNAKLAVTTLALAGLVVPGLVRQPLFWFAVVALRMFWHFPGSWFRTDNHQYLLVYWCAAIGLALLTDDFEETLRRTAGWLIGLTFTFATLWKIISPDFLSGAFLHYTMIADSRFAEFADTVGGLAPDLFSANRSAVSSLRNASSDGVSVVLNDTARLAAFGPILAWWTVIIEGLVALSFLLRRSALWRWRHAVLLVFIVTTYPIATVVGFGWLLVAMGVANLDRRVLTDGDGEDGGDGAPSRTIFWYVVLFLLLPLFKTPFLTFLLGSGSGGGTEG